MKTINYNFSVIIPCYNSGMTLERTVLSILNQSLENVEVIIVNDASTDAYTLEKLKEFEKYVKIIHLKKNGGLSNARNVGLNNSYGDYTLCLDSDDYIDKTYLEKAKKVFDESRSIGVVSPSVQMFGESCDNWIPKETFSIGELLAINQVPGAASCVRRSVYNDIGGYDTTLSSYEDWEFWIRVFSSDKKWDNVVIPEFLFFYNIHSDSMQHSMNDEKMSEVLNIILEKHKELYRIHFAEIFTNLHIKYTINRLSVRKVSFMIEERDIWLKEKNAQIKEQNSQIKEQNSQIKEQNSQIKEQNSQIQEKDTKISSIIESKTYKLGDLFFRSVKKPYKLITYPYNFIKIIRAQKNEGSQVVSSIEVLDDLINSKPDCERGLSVWDVQYRGKNIKVKDYAHITMMRLGESSSFENSLYLPQISSIELLETWIRLGTKFLLVENLDLKTANIDILQRSKDAGIFIIFFVHSKNEIIEDIISLVDLIIFQDLALKKYVDTINARSILVPLSADSEIFNPIGWKNIPNNIVSVFDDESLCSELKSNLVIGENIKISKITKDDDVNGLKRDVAIICNREAFTSDFLYIQKIAQFAASGIIVITQKNHISEKYIDKDICAQVAGLDELSEEVCRLVSNREYREKKSIMFRSRTLSNLSVTKCFEVLLQEIKISLKSVDKISIILSTMRPETIEHSLNIVEKQNYPVKELILLLHGDNFDVTDVEERVKNLSFEVKVIQKNSNTIFGDNLNVALAHTTGKYVAKMDDDDLYGESHLKDLYIAYQYSGASIVGRWASLIHLKKMKKIINFCEEQTEKYGNHLGGGTILMLKSDLVEYGFGSVSTGIDSQLYGRMVGDGHILYATHQYNYVYIREENSNHTYKQSDDYFYKRKTRDAKDQDKMEDCFLTF